MFFLYMELMLNGFEAGKSITWGTGRAVPRKSRLFWILPPQNHYVQNHINKRYINSYTLYLFLPTPLSLCYKSESNSYLLGGGGVALPSPLPIQPFVHNNLEINSDM